MKTIEELLEELELVAAMEDAVIHNISFRRAGVGVLWHEESRMSFVPHEESPEYKDTWKTGLVTYGYHSSLRECLEFELDRVRSKGLRLVT